MYVVFSRMPCGVAEINRIPRWCLTHDPVSIYCTIIQMTFCSPDPELRNAIPDSALWGVGVEPQLYLMESYSIEYWRNEYSQYNKNDAEQSYLFFCLQEGGVLHGIQRLITMTCGMLFFSVIWRRQSSRGCPCRSGAPGGTFSNMLFLIMFYFSNDT